MARTYNDIYYNDDENSTAEILDDMKKLAESVDQQIGSIKSFNNDTSQFIEQVTPLMNTLSEQVIDMHQLADTMFTELEQVKEENKQLREDLNGLPKGQASGESIDLNDSAEMRCELKISGNSVQDGEPTSDEPVEVESCGDNINLIDCVSINGYTKSSGEIVFNASTDYLSVPDIIEVKPNTTYTIDFVGYEDGNFLVPEFDKNKTFIQRLSYSTRTFTTSSNCYYIFPYLYKSSSYNIIGTKIKMVKGTRIDGYSTYGQGCINEVICNKNLLDLTKKPYSESASTLNGAIVSINNGVLTVDATNSTGTTHIKSEWKPYTDNSTILIPKGTYYTSLLLNLTGVVSLVSKQVGGIFTLEEDCYLTQWFFTVSQGNKMTKALQIEEGQTATEYVEHKSQTYTIPTQQPMRSIGDIRDTFIKKDGKWYERHYINRIIFNGLEDDFTVRNSGDEKTTYSFNYGITNVKNFGKEYIVSNMFTYNQTSTNGKEGIGIPNNLENQIYFQIKRSRLSDISSSSEALNSFKNYLKELYNSNNPLYIDYVLKTPNDIECTEEQSTILFDIEQNAKTYDKVTHMYSTDNVSPVIDVTYKKDIETLFANTLVEGV